MFKKIFFILVFELIFFGVFSQKTEIKIDTGKYVIPRTSEKIKDFLNDETFYYNEKNAVSPETLIQKIIFFIRSAIASLFRVLEYGNGIVKFLFYLVLILILAFIVMKISGLSPFGLFAGQVKIKNENIPVFDEDIDSFDFDKVISDAVKNENYRKAVRFLYIKLLKILSDNELIEWRKEKTNKDYKNEMKGKELFHVFNVLTQTYEYVWYGEFKIRKKYFFDIYKKFNAVYEKLNAKKRH